MRTTYKILIETLQLHGVLALKQEVCSYPELKSNPKRRRKSNGALSNFSATRGKIPRCSSHAK
jgi:hypothetical protein